MDSRLLEGLGGIIRGQQAEIWLDANRLDKLLNEKFKGAGVEREIIAILNALKFGAPQILLRKGDAVSRNLVIEIANRMGNSDSISQNESNWAVACWAFALGLSTDFESIYVQEEPTAINTPSIPGELVSYRLDETGQLKRESPDAQPLKLKRTSNQPLYITGNATPKRSPSFNVKGNLKFGVVKGGISLALAMLGVFMIALASKASLIIAFAAIVIALWLFFIPTCPKCQSTKIAVISREVTHSRYLHPRKDGEADRRYSNNPLIQSLLVTHQCYECDKTWKTKETQNA